MGGEGSGRWKDHEKRRTVEDTWALDIAAMPLRGSLSYPLTGSARAIRITGDRNALAVRYSLVEDEEGPALDLTYALERSLLETFSEPGPTERVAERVRLLATEPARGGVRWWFACPFALEGGRCRRRVAKLHLPPGGNGFGCRRCHDLTYESSQESHAMDGLAAHMAAGDRSGLVYTLLMAHFTYLVKEVRRLRKKNAMSPSLFDAFEEMFGPAKGSSERRDR